MTFEEWEQLDQADMQELDRAWKLKERRVAMRHARLLALLANINRSKGAPPITAEALCEIDPPDDD